MKTTAEQFRKLLPTLQHVARFPSCNRSAICRRDGVGIAELDAVIMGICGSPAIFDEEYLAKAAAELGVSLPPFKPGGSGTRSAPVRLAVVADKPAAAALAGDLKFENKIAAVRPAAKPRPEISPAEPKPHEGRAPCRLAEYIEVCRLMWADPALSEGKACVRVGVRQGSWSYFKAKTFSSGPIARQKLAAFLGVDPGPSAATPDALTEQPRAAVCLAPNKQALGLRESYATMVADLERSRAEIDQALAIARGQLKAVDEMLAAFGKGAAA